MNDAIAIAAARAVRKHAGATLRIALWVAVFGPLLPFEQCQNILQNRQSRHSKSSPLRIFKVSQMDKCRSENWHLFNDQPAKQ